MKSLTKNSNFTRFKSSAVRKGKFMRRLLMEARLCILLLSLASACPSNGEKPLLLGKHGTQLQLFFDDFIIDKLSGEAKQVLQKPIPKEVVLNTDAPWEGNTCAYFTIFRDGNLFRMYYRGSHYDEKTKKAAHREVTCYAESKDGIRWTKPKLGLFAFNGSKENNIVWNGIGAHCFVAFKDTNPNCPPDARYKGISAAYPPENKKGLYVFRSPDGIHWRQIHKEPVITHKGFAFDSQNLAFWDKHSKLYREYHRVYHRGKRAIMTSASKDFINWTKPTLLVYQKDTPLQHLYTNAVQPYEREPTLLVAFPTRYLPDQGSRVEPTFMASRDGLRFHRWLEPVIPETAPKDRGGNRSNYMAWGIVEIPERPNHYSVYATESAKVGPDSRLRRFEYRKDGFVSIEAGSTSGQLLTKPIRLGASADRLTLNFKTRKGGYVRVGIETIDGKTIPNYEIESCEALRGDSLSQMATWGQSSDLSSLEGKIVKLRIKMKDAELYSFQFRPLPRSPAATDHFKPSVVAEPAKIPLADKWTEWEANATPYGGAEVLAKIRKAKESGSHFINLEASGMTDLAPLAGWTKMGTLGIGGNQINDLTPVASLTNLVHLISNENQISDLTPVAGLTKLAHLISDDNRISDLTPLAKLTNLEHLALGYNKITDVTPLKGLINLTELSLPGNEIADLTQLAGLAKLTKLHLYDNSITDLRPLARLSNLETLDLPYNAITDIRPLTGLTKLKVLRLRNNPITSDQKKMLRKALPLTDIDF